MNKKNLCIIPARGGSKRLPGKNLLPLGGRPLIAHTIEHALQSKYIQKVIVSTNDFEISHVAKKYGAQVVHRPEEISGDYATSEAALLHAYNEIVQSGFCPDLVIFLQCTSPIREPWDIDRAIEKLYAENADSLLSGSKNERFFWRRSSENTIPINYDYRHRMRDQDHPEEYEENGSIYIFKPDILLKTNNRLGGKIAMYEMDYWSSFQIDSPEHFLLLEWIIEQKRKSSRMTFLPSNVRLVVSDFDGVLTNNKVIVREDGYESVICDRGDGLGIAMLQELGIPFLVISKESNPVVDARCKKLNVVCFQSVDEKLSILQKIVDERGIELNDVLYVGNDINDLTCLSQVGCSVAVADSHPEVLSMAQIVLRSTGGNGAIRELCELLIEKIAKEKKWK